MLCYTRFISPNRLKPHAVGAGLTSGDQARFLNEIPERRTDENSNETGVHKGWLRQVNTEKFRSSAREIARRHDTLWI
jgi:hypothetical protein